MTPAGGNVLIECHGRREYAELVIRDNGMGISAEVLPHVFDPLWQMQHARADTARAGGVWLGLAVVHRIIELHGGRIVVSSDGHSMGAVFTVRLPLATTSPELGRTAPIERAASSLRSIEKGIS